MSRGCPRTLYAAHRQDVVEGRGTFKRDLKLASCEKSGGTFWQVSFMASYDPKTGDNAIVVVLKDDTHLKEGEELRVAMQIKEEDNARTHSYSKIVAHTPRHCVSFKSPATVRVEKRREQELIAFCSAGAQHTGKDMLFANVSHELKTPLNGIIALAEHLEGELKEAEGVSKQNLSSLSVIRSSGLRLNNLVTNLLDVS